MSLTFRGLALAGFIFFASGCDQFEKSPTVNPIGVPGLVPTQVKALGSETAWISAGRTHTCAVKKDGTAHCWGSNRMGELGVADAVEKQPIPQAVEGAPALTKITAGDRVSCGVTTDKTAVCWGANNYFQLGQGEALADLAPRLVPEAGAPAEENAPAKVNARLRSSAAPVQVVGIGGEGALSDVASLSSSNHRVCAVLSKDTNDGAGVCWGNNISVVDMNTKPGDPPKLELKAVKSGKPTYVEDDPKLAVGSSWQEAIKSLAILNNEACAITYLDEVRCQYGTFPIDSTLVAIAASEKNYCITFGTEKTETHCYESGKGRDSRTALKIPDDTIDIAMGATHGCALTKTGQVWCWGNNRYGQIGTGDRNDSNLAPTRVAKLGAADQIAVGGTHSCARLLDGTTWCWGNSEFGQVGIVE